MADQSTQQETQFSNDARGWAARIKRELEAARKALKDWHEQAQRATEAYLDDRSASALVRDDFETKWNIFTSDTQVQEAILYGNPPRVTVSRRFADASDDVGRVAGVIQERMLNEDIEGDDDSFAQALEYANSERQIVGFGLARIRYEMGEPEVVPGKPALLHPVTGEEMSEAVPDVERRPNEKVETDWVHYRDVLWGPCRVWHESPWVAFASDMSPQEVTRTFGEKLAAALPLNSKKDSAKEGQVAQPWDRVRLWEVWVKEEKQVFRYVEGYPEVLAPVGVEVEPNGGQADPLGLTGFYPCPRPLFANLTTTKLVPKPDREIARDLYDEVNDLSSRIRALQDAIRVAGMYDESNKELGRMLDGRGNVMIPVKQWAGFGEKGGIKGAVDWFPLDQVVNALGVLREQRREQVDALREITGMSDIMRGASSDGADTATESRIKSRFGSVRMQKRQKEFAKFASNLQRLRGEVMAKHFEPSTYAARCNLEKSPDAQLVDPAIQLLQSDFAKYRIEVKPETVSMTDFDALKQEKTEVVSSISQYFTAVAPMVQQMPAATPYVLEILRWMVAGLRGASEIEGVLDQAIDAAEKAQQQAAANPAPPPTDPKVQAQQLKMQGDQMKAQTDLQASQFKLQADLTKIGAETQAHAQQEQAQAEWNTRESAQKALIQQNLKEQTASLTPTQGGGGFGG